MNLNMLMFFVNNCVNHVSSEVIVNTLVSKKQK